VNPRVGVDDVEKWKFLTPTPVIQSVGSRYTDCATAIHEVERYLVKLASVYPMDPYVAC
jgi:hypothetical protein